MLTDRGSNHMGVWSLGVWVGGGLVWGVPGQRQTSPQEGAQEGDLRSFNRMTHACENITFPVSLCYVVGNWLTSVEAELSVLVGADAGTTVVTVGIGVDVRVVVVNSLVRWSIHWVVIALVVRLPDLQHGVTNS